MPKTPSPLSRWYGNIAILESPIIITRGSRRADQSTLRPGVIRAQIPEVFDGAKAWKTLELLLEPERGALRLANLRAGRNPIRPWVVQAGYFQGKLRVLSNQANLNGSQWRLELRLETRSPSKISVLGLKTSTPGVQIKRVGPSRYEISVKAPIMCQAKQFREKVLLEIEYQINSKGRKIVQSMAVDDRCLLGDVLVGNNHKDDAATFSALARQARKDPQVRSLVTKSQAMPPLKGKDEAEVLVKQVRRLVKLSRVKYVSDPADGPPNDYFLSPSETLRFGGGDCEDLSLLAGAYLAELGYKVRLVMIPGHVYCQVLIRQGESYQIMDVDLAKDADVQKGEILPWVRPAEKGYKYGLKYFVPMGKK